MIRDNAFAPRIQDLEMAAVAASAVHPSSAAEDAIYALHKHVMWLVMQSTEDTANDLICLVEYFRSEDSDVSLSINHPYLPTLPRLLSKIVDERKYVLETRAEALWALFNHARTSPPVPGSRSGWPQTLLEWEHYIASSILSSQRAGESLQDLSDLSSLALLVWAAWFFCREKWKRNFDDADPEGDQEKGGDSI